MATILIVAEHQDGVLKKSTLQSIDFARQLVARTGGSYDLAVLGDAAEAVADQLAPYGAGTIHLVTGEAWSHYLAQPYSAALVQLLGAAGATCLVASSGTFGKDLLPRVAAARGWGMVADCVGLDEDPAELLYLRPMYAGNVIASVRVTTPGSVISVRGSEFDAAEPAGDPSTISAFQADGGSYSARYVRYDQVESERPDLSEADVVVSGGRGLKDGDSFFAVMDPLARALNAGLGASRAAVDSGFCPNDFQVGQTGKVVAPALYFAVAISGAIQHLAGMKNSKCIVAINKDPEAPIFQIADYGLVADAFKAVPELVEKL